MRAPIVFLAHAESEKPFVEAVKDSITSLARSKRIRAVDVRPDEPPRVPPEVYYD
jgi:hypothetical protein